jgi:SRSO17 transposase
MTGASIETTLELLASSLLEVKVRMRGLFTQERVAASANLFLDGLLGDERRKTGWMRAEAAGDPGPWRQQAILGRGRWEADGLRDIVRDYVVEHLATDEAVLVIDETGFLKQGKASCGVARQPYGQTAASRRPEPMRITLSPSRTRLPRSGFVHVVESRLSVI